MITRLFHSRSRDLNGGAASIFIVGHLFEVTFRKLRTGYQQEPQQALRMHPQQYLGDDFIRKPNEIISSPAWNTPSLFTVHFRSGRESGSTKNATKDNRLKLTSRFGLWSSLPRKRKSMVCL
ncbi:hypothetical protein MLD38_001116 [Melastoma candidum]|uniref:Uncharacterized protein n=1 Tax=Melastoma candidum TaxID=119954 RepID=A0ACB9SD63_9MYRT|nr:hypothetical protein MLD38_001116 [Melastoma candidum]